MLLFFMLFYFKSYAFFERLFYLFELVKDMFLSVVLDDFNQLFKCWCELYL